MFMEKRPVGRRRRAGAAPSAASRVAAVCDALERRVLLTVTVNAPTGLVGARLSDDAIELMWGDNSGEDGFVILKHEGSATAPPEEISTFAGTEPYFQYVDWDVLPGTTYFYEVKAQKGDSFSDLTPIISVGTPPGGLSAKPANWDGVNVVWPDFATGETDYVVQRKLTNGHTWVDVGTASPDSTWFYVPDAHTLFAYEYHVKAEWPGTSIDSNSSLPFTMPAEPTIPPAAPTNLTLTGINSSQVGLSWDDNADDETGYLIEYKPDGAADFQPWADPIPADTTNWTVHDLPYGTRYTFRVTAINHAGASTPSNTPSIFWAVDWNGISATSDGRVHMLHVTWPNAEGESGFELWRHRDGDTDELGNDVWRPAGSFGPDVTQFDDYGENEPGGELVDGTLYLYGVVVKGAEGEDSARAANWCQTPDFQLFDAPQGEWHNELNTDPNTLKDTPDMPGVFSKQMISVNLTYGEGANADAPDQSRAEAAASRAEEKGTDIVIDIENWPRDTRRYSTQEVQQSLDQMEQLIAWMRAKWSDLGYTTGRIGIYEGGDVNFITYNYPAGERIFADDNAQLDAWRASLRAFGPLMQPFALGGQTVDGVDFLEPTLYVDDTDWGTWVATAQLTLREYQSLGKEFNLPVYPFVHPNSDMGASVPQGMWRFELELIRSMADGVAVWYSPTTSPIYDGGEAVYGSAPFYQELNDFSYWGRVRQAPSVPDSTAIDAVGPHVTWTDTATDDADHDAFGWVVEGSRDGRDWIPVGGGYAGGDNSWLDTFARPGTTNAYRVRAVNAFGGATGSDVTALAVHRDAMHSVLDPSHRIEAEMFDASDGTGQVPTSQYNGVLTHVYSGRWARYNDVDFGSGDATRLKLRLQRHGFQGTMHVWAVDHGATISVNGSAVTGGNPVELASVDLHVQDAVFTELNLPLLSSGLGVGGVRDIVLTFDGYANGAPLVDLDWFEFLSS